MRAAVDGFRGECCNGAVSTDLQERLRRLPSVDELLKRPRIEERANGSGRALVVAEARAVVDELREAIRKSGDAAEGASQPIDTATLAATAEAEILQRLDALGSASLRHVINATGVVLHTNLGRAPLSDAAVRAIAETAGGYSNLEYDLASGKRGMRDVHAGGLLEKLLGAPAIVVNNNAAAIFLVLNELASDGEVIVSRGELIEIGDGFRIPDIMARSGATLRETGTTNRTALSDYRNAVSEKTRMLLRVHPSNFRIVGFTARPALDELVALGGELQLPVVEDLGSGCLYDFAQQGFENEPPVVESLRAGVDLVTFSGDKLLGGPQAGIIAGKPEWLRRVRRNPLFRALRVDKLTCAALEATLRDYLFGRYDRIPVLRMIRASAEEIRRRAEGFVADLSLGDSISIELAAGESVLGGGSTPAQSIPTTLIRIQPGNGQSVARIEARLRQGDPPVVARIEDNCLLIDLRTVHPKEEEGLSHGLRHAFGEGDDNELEVGRDFL